MIQYPNIMMCTYVIYSMYGAYNVFALFFVFSGWALHLLKELLKRTGCNLPASNNKTIYCEITGKEINNKE